DGDGADGAAEEAVGDVLPDRPAVGRPPHAAASAAEIEKQRLAGHARDRGRAPAPEGTDRAGAQRAEPGFIIGPGRVLQGRRAQARPQRQPDKDQTPQHGKHTRRRPDLPEWTVHRDLSNREPASGILAFRAGPWHFFPASGLRPQVIGTVGARMRTTTAFNDWHAAVSTMLG